MARHDFPIVGSFGEEIVSKINAERSINLYKVSSPNGKKQDYLSQYPGKLAKGVFTYLNNGRASFNFVDTDYFVVGDSIYSMDESLVIEVIALHFFTTLTGHVGIAANENQIIFVDGIKSFLWDINTEIGIDNTPNLPTGFAPLDVTFMDGYFILISSSTGFQNRFYISSLNDGSMWNILDFALINSRPTFLAAVAVLKRRVFFFGQTKSEIWLDAGTS